MKNNKNKQAFTLIEVLVASFLSVLTVTTSYMLLQQSGTILESSSSRVEALFDARSAMEYLRSLAFDSDQLKPDSHILTLNDKEFSYKVSAFNGSSIMKSIELDATWNSATSGKARTVNLSSLISSPLHAQAGGLASSGSGKSNNGHGNNIDGVDSSNPGNSKVGEDTNPDVDDEKDGDYNDWDDNTDVEDWEKEEEEKKEKEEKEKEKKKKKEEDKKKKWNGEKDD